MMKKAVCELREKVRETNREQQTTARPLLLFGNSFSPRAGPHLWGKRRKKVTVIRDTKKKKVKANTNRVDSSLKFNKSDRSGTIAWPNVNANGFAIGGVKPEIGQVCDGKTSSWSN